MAYDSTPLIVAVRRGNTNLASILVGAGADLEATDREGFTALFYAGKANHQEILQLLTDAGAKPVEYAEGSAEAALMAAARSGDCDRIQRLLDAGLDPNIKRGTLEEAERTALIHAAENGHAEAVRLLLKAGAKPDEKCGKAWDEAWNRTALMHAARAGQLEVVSMLIEAGASVSATDQGIDGGGRTPLHYAAEAGHAPVIRALVKAGAKVNAKTRRGEIPLKLAAGGGHAEATKVLKELEAASRFSKQGYSAETSERT